MKVSQEILNRAISEVNEVKMIKGQHPFPPDYPGLEDYIRAAFEVAPSQKIEILPSALVAAMKAFVQDLPRDFFLALDRWGDNYSIFAVPPSVGFKKCSVLPPQRYAASELSKQSVK